MNDQAATAQQDAAIREGAQCWICPHCFNDHHHHSDAQGCELHASRNDSRLNVGPTDI